MEITECWALEYKPNFKNFHFQKDIKNKLKNLLENNVLNLNLYLIGVNGCGKNTIIKLILDYCFNIGISEFKINEKLENSLFYESICIMDFINLHQNRAKNMLDYIQIFSKKNMLFTNFQKIIILKHVEYLEKHDLLKHLKNIINKNSLYCKFIISSNKKFSIFNGLLCPFRIPKLDYDDFKKLVSNLNQIKDINMKKYKLNYKSIYMFYKKSSYNLKDTLLWYQYSIESNITNLVPIKTKIVSEIVKYLFIKEFKINNFEKIRSKILKGLSIGLTENDILINSIKLIINNSKITSNLKNKSTQLASTINQDMIFMDRPIFALENIFFDIYTSFIKFNLI